MVRTVQLGHTYWLTLALAVIAAGFLVRLFIFFHDCTHRSFFASDRANTIVGYVLGILTFTPYEEWRHSHVIHHATAGNLDKRGVGDVWTMTVEEYRAGSKWQRLAYLWYASTGICLDRALCSHATVFAGKTRKSERLSSYHQPGALAIIVIASLTSASYLLLGAIAHHPHRGDGGTVAILCPTPI